MGYTILHQGSFDRGWYQSRIYSGKDLVRFIDSTDTLRCTPDGAHIWEAVIKNKLGSDGTVLFRNILHFAERGDYVINQGPNNPYKVRKEQDDFAKKVLEEYLAIQ